MLCVFPVGIMGGLSLVLNTKQYEYPRLLMPGAAFFIAVHDASIQVPEMYANSLVVSVGQDTRIAIEQTNVRLYQTQL